MLYRKTVLDSTLGNRLLVFCSVLKFDLTFYPHRIEEFSRLLERVCGKDDIHKVYGDYKPLDGDTNTSPVYYVHVVEKAM
jgi:hypothetical protein